MEMNNLAADPKYRDVIANLKAKLDAWMQEQGDQGIQTELDALNHQTRALKRQKNAAKKTRRRPEEEVRSQPRTSLASERGGRWGFFREGADAHYPLQPKTTSENRR